MFRNSWTHQKSTLSNTLPSSTATMDHTTYDVFMELYGNMPLAINMVQSLVDALDLTKHHLIEELRFLKQFTTSNKKQNTIHATWYKVACLHLDTQNRHQTLKTRLKSECAMRTAWRLFLVSLQREIPEVPPLP
jgi:hypothetical protein